MEYVTPRAYDAWYPIEIEPQFTFGPENVYGAAGFGGGLRVGIPLVGGRVGFLRASEQTTPPDVRRIERSDEYGNPAAFRRSSRSNALNGILMPRYEEVPPG